MAISCTPNDLASAAAQFQGLAADRVNGRAVEIYLLALIAGVDPDPEALATAAKCYCAIAQNDDLYKAIVVYLTCQASS